MKLSQIVKTDNIIKINPDATLSQALSKLSSSHDAAFVLDEENNLLGVINPYYALISNSYPANAKVSHCMTMPPKLTEASSVADAIRLMSESKIHYLPVVDDQKKFLGIVSARRILAKLADSPTFNVAIADLIHGKKPFISIEEDEMLSKALHMFKEHKISKLIVLNHEGKLKGVLAYYDLISYLAVPKQRASDGDRKGQKAPFLSFKVKNFMKTMVLTLTPKNSLVDVVKLILDKKIGSVVVVDGTHKPIGIITTKDVLKLLTQHGVGINLEVVGKNLSKMSHRIVDSFSRPFLHAMAKKHDLQKATLIVKEEKNGGLFEVLFSGFFKRGNKEVIRREGRDLGVVLSEVKDTLKQE